jgi:hypothetical protein
MSGTQNVFGAVGKYHINSLSGNYSKIAEEWGAMWNASRNLRDIYRRFKEPQKLVKSGKPVLLEFMTRVEDENLYDTCMVTKIEAQRGTGLLVPLHFSIKKD